MGKNLPTEEEVRLLSQMQDDLELPKGTLVALDLGPQGYGYYFDFTPAGRRMLELVQYETEQVERERVMRKNAWREGFEDGLFAVHMDVDEMRNPYDYTP